MNRLRIWLLLVSVALLGGCASMRQDAGFDPARDAQLALAQASAPTTTKQDPAASQWLASQPTEVSGYDIVEVKLGDVIPPVLQEELLDARRVYPQAILRSLKRTDEGVQIELECKFSQERCTDFRSVKTSPARLERLVFRAAVYGSDGKPEQLYDAVWRKSNRKFLILFPAFLAKTHLGKPVYVWGANGGFLIRLDGTLIDRPAKDILNLPPDFFATHPSRLSEGQILPVRRTDAAGQFLLETIVKTFPLPAPFHKGAARVEYYLGASRLTREDNMLDCWIGHGGGNFFVGLSPIPGQAVLSFLMSVGASLPSVNRCVEGASRLESTSTNSVPAVGSPSALPDPGSS